MARYQILTLVDITRTSVGRSETDPKKIGQQANFNSLLQAIGLRANITWEQDPEIKDGRLPHPRSGKANHWTWEFDTERDLLFYKDDADPTGLLLDDLHGVPIISQLNNSIDIHPSIFATRGEYTNTWIYELRDFG
jgi:hypothetical protein